MSIYGNLLIVGYDLTDIIFLCNCGCFCTYILFWNFISAYRESSGNRFYVPYLQTYLEMKTSGECGILKRYLL